MDEQAVVIGAGIAGLTAAQVLSRRFSHVTVLDRDDLPDAPVPRRGVPQGAHPHLLLVSGLNALTTLFPGLDADLTAAGGLWFDSGTGLCVYRLGRRWPNAPTGVTLLSVSRPQLETVIRQRVAATPNVTIRDNVAVSGLIGDGDRVTGVRLDDGEVLPTALVVDGTGRSARSDSWLGDLGWPAPARVEVKIGVAYATRIYRREPDQIPGWQGMIVLPTPPHETASGLAIPIEGDRWLINVGGWHQERPPGDPASFEAAARALPDSGVYDVMSKSEPLSDIVTHGYPASRWRRFDELGRLPGGYAAVGDAFCSFNPIYGQGMTCAALEATALGDALDRHDGATGPDTIRDYYAAAARTIATPWQFAVGGDFGWPQTVGPRPRGVAVRNWYARQIGYASQIDPEVNATFIAVQHLLESPDVLMKPRFLAKVLRTRLSAGAPSR
ncbi:NAD(P)/FAD-dependent oxidoreductase [Actinoplanes sp. NPDC051851]|uniref:FAD-dependent oxidoreductase n=1 Tax=Actinoplanes sp. NPDC051851 TaxID=3154753 RepID=UPI003440E17F